MVVSSPISQASVRPAVPDALRAWRERGLVLVLRVSAIAALPAVLLDIVGSVQRGTPGWAVASSSALLLLFALAFWPHAPYRLRAYCLLLLACGFSFMTTMHAGLVGPGRILALAVVLNAVVFLDRREALGFAVLAFGLLLAPLGGVAVGLVPVAPSLAARVADPNTILVNSLTVVAVTAILSSAVASLIGRLIASLREAEAALAERDGVATRLERLMEERTEELRRSQDLLQGLLDHSPAAVYVKDLEGRYLLTNRYMHGVHGLSALQMDGRRDLELFGKDAEAWHDHEREVIERGAPVALEVVTPHLNGKPHTYYEIKFPLRDASGAVRAIGGIAADITSRKLTEETLGRQLAVQAAVAQCARTLLRATVAAHQRDSLLEAVFEEFRQHVGIAHLGLYEFLDYQGVPSYRALFQLPDRTRSPSPPSRDNLHPRFLARIMAGQPFFGPGDQVVVAGSPNRAALERRNIVYVAACPIIVDGRVWGMASFGDSQPGLLTEVETLQPLTAMAEMIGAFLSRIESSTAIELQSAYARALARCSGALLTQIESRDSAGEVMIEAVQHLRDAIGCRRAYIYETREHEGGFMARAVAEACAPGDSSDPRTGLLPSGLFPAQILDDLYAGRARGGPIRELLAEKPEYVALLEGAGVGSVLFTPLHVGGCLWGFLGLSDADPARVWGDAETRLFQTAAEMFAAFAQSRQLLQSLRERDRFIKRVTEASPDVIYVFDSRLGRNVFANREIAEVLGYTAEEAGGLGANPMAALMHPEDLDRLPRFLAEMAVAPDHQVLEFEYRARHKDGRMRWLVNRQVIFARDESGRPVQVVGLARDITVSKEAGLAVERSESLLRTISDAIPDGYLYQVLQRRDGTYVRHTYVSRGVERLLGVSPEVVMADPKILHDTFLPEDQPLVHGADLESVRTMTVFDVEARRRKADGRVGWFHVRSVPQELPDGMILWNGVCLEVTGRKETELALTHANMSLRRRIDELGALNAISQALMSWTDLPAALRTVGSMLLPLFGAERIAIWLREEGRETVTLTALIGHDEVTEGGTTVRLRNAPLARAVMTTRQGSVLDGGRTDPVVIPALSQGFDAFGSSALVQPLLMRGVPIGLLVVRGAIGRPSFTPADVELAQTSAGLLSSAIENGRLLQRTMIEAAQEERRRLARELHDSITQSLYSLMLLARAWSRMAEGATPADLGDWLGQVEGIALQSLKEMRLLIYQLRSPELSQLGLAEALRQRLEAVESRGGVTVRLEAEGYSHGAPPETEAQIFAIVQEALNNVLRHAQARTVVVSLGEDEEGLEVDVADDGVGFAQAESSGGLGLTTMRERAEAIRGSLTIATTPGAGTTVSLRLPYAALANTHPGARAWGRTRRRKR